MEKEVIKISEKNNTKIVYQNYDVQPKFLGIFNYITIFISLGICVPIVYITYNLDISVNIKIYSIFFTIFPILLFNIIFARADNIHLYIFYAIKYYLSSNTYVYSKKREITKY